MNRAPGFHPSVGFAYTLALATIAMLFFNPFFTVLGIIFAVIDGIILSGTKSLLRGLAAALPFYIIVALFNPIISHGGKTPLFFLFGNPITLEATLYGVCSGGVLILVLLWFGVYNRLVTPDRFMYLFSRIAPSASMLVTMTQRMTPLFSRRLAAISAEQRTLKPGDGKGRANERFRNGLDEISILLSWSMEEGLDTADSMKARGYGCAKRTAFSVFNFTPRDAAALFGILITSVFCIAFYYMSVRFSFYPRIQWSFGPGGGAAAALYILLAAAFPVYSAARAVWWKLYEK